MLTYTCLNAQISYEIRMSYPIEDDVFRDPVCDSNGNTFVSYGYGLSNMNHLCSQSYLFKIDSIGDTTRFGFNKQDTVLSFLPMMDSDGHLLLSGEGYRKDSTGYVSGKFQFFSKMSTELAVFWQRYYHLDSDSDLTFTTILSEYNQNSYIRASAIKNMSSGEFKMFSFKMDKEGDSLNYFVYDSDLMGALYSMTFDANDTSLIEYHLTIWEYPTTYCGRLLLDESFNLISLNKYSDYDYRTPFFTMRFAEDNYLSGGSHGFGRDYIQVRKMDNSLNVINSIDLCYNEDETCPAWIKCIDFWNPDRIFVAGVSPYYSNAIPNYIYVACLDSNLNLIDEEYLGGDGYYDVISIAASPDGGVIIAGGYTDVTVQPLQKDGYLIKLDSSMFVGLPEEYNNGPGSAIQIFPNPANSRVSISSVEDDYSIKLQDITGKIILQYRICSHDVNLDISDVMPGVYILTAISRKFSFSKKLFIN
jgi:hypothetical protein